MKYEHLLNTVDGVRDNAGLMAIKFIAGFGIKEFYLAGFDGFSHDVNRDFEARDMVMLHSPEAMDRINKGMQQVLEIFSKKFRIHFLTESLIMPKKFF